MMHRVSEINTTALEATFTTVESAVADRVRSAILTGELPPGTRMRQAELAERMSISITPIRAALRQLAAEGLIHIEPRRTVSVHRPSMEELSEVYEIRALLEPTCMKKTVKRISEEDVARAEELVDAMGSGPGASEWDVFNRTFHALLIEASGSPRLEAILLNLLSLATMGMRASGVLSDQRMREANEEHRLLLAACRDRDADAARAMTLKHLRSSMKLAGTSGK